MMKSKHNEIIADIILTPLSYLFRTGVGVRNRLFDLGFLHRHKFNIPVVVVGNIAVGGTGKTPHTEYIVRALCNKYHIGVLSRGYKRKTKGFVLADLNLSSADLGDEPYQIFRKFGSHISLAVCEDRVKGIHEMLKIDPAINLFVLDDAFQHRYVSPKVAIALVDFRNPPYEDQMMPLGTLREPLHALLRADMVVVTKCPEDIKPMDVRLIKSKLNLYPSQEVYFSKMVYRSPLAVFPNQANYQPDLNWLNSNDSILVFTGVAVPMPLIKYLKQFEAKVKVIHFGDHHAFTREDFTFIYENFKKMGGDRRIIITTEKDAMRIINHPYFPHELKKWLFYIPIEVEFLPGDDNFIEHLDTMIQK